MIYESNYYVGSDLNGDSLSHHGVPHQQWGVQNGPPYPIQRGHDVKYSVGKMTEKTKAGLQKAGKIAGETVTNAAKTVVKKTNSSFQKWKENTKMDLATKDTNSAIMKRWQKKQLRISEMSNQELQQRIDRKKLEETYKHALRGDFSAPTSWKNSKSGQNGKDVADGILKKIGNAAIDGLAKGLSSKIEESMTAKAKAKVARKEARKNAIEDVARKAAKERDEYRAAQGNKGWKERQQRRNEDNEYWRKTRRRSSGDGAMDPIMGRRSRPRSSGFIGGPSGKPNGSYYYASPDEVSFR